MRIVLAAVLAATVGMAHAQEGGIEGVIAAQIEAFRADDFATAFGFASPGIQRMFGTPETFGQMVRQGYPMVHRPEGLRFLGQREQGGRVLQTVQMRGPDGALHTLLYEMVQVNGIWRIDGVQVLRDPGVGA